MIAIMIGIGICQRRDALAASRYQSGESLKISQISPGFFGTDLNEHPTTDIASIAKKTKRNISRYPVILNSDEVEGVTLKCRFHILGMSPK
jgi:hypothetical protein